MPLTAKKAQTAAATVREAIESGEFPNTTVRAMRTTADALEAYAGDDTEE